MIGFKHTFSAREAKEHRDKLISKVSDGYKCEIEQIYEWMTNETFLTALRVQTIEQWQYCKQSMVNPPNLFIDEAIKQCTHTEMFQSSYPIPYTTMPTCSLCNSSLAKSTTEKVKFCVISCHCGSLYCHEKCVHKESCYLCKQYYVVETKNCPLIATIGDH